MRRSCGRALLYAASLLAVLSPSGCPGSAAPRLPSDGARNDAEVADLSRPIDHGSVEAEVPQDLPAPSPDSTPSGPAYLHADVWSIWWNDRTRCGAERTFLQICQARGEADCSLYQQAYVACKPLTQVYGQVGPEKQSEALCQRGKLPAVGGCVAASYDFGQLPYWWYGAEWQGNWPVATLKVFPQGKDWKGGGELIALSTHPGLTQAAMAGLVNHGLGWGCAMQGQTSGDAAYRTPFGGFAWVEVPVGTKVSVVAMASSNFAGQAFAGCSRGAATQTPWVAAPPGAQLGCVYVQENVTFEAGRHYLWRHGKISQLSASGPPQDLRDAFARPEVSKNVATRDACKL